MNNIPSVACDVPASFITFSVATVVGSTLADGDCLAIVANNEDALALMAEDEKDSCMSVNEACLAISVGDADSSMSDDEA